MKERDMPKGDAAFKAEVLTHLRYIKEKQDQHDDTFEQLKNQMMQVDDKLVKQLNECNGRFGCIENKLAKAEGMAKGAMAIGGGGGILGFLMSMFKFWR